MMTLLGAGGIMFSTYVVLNHFLNREPIETTNVQSNSLSRSARDHLKGTYSYVLGGIAISAASAVAAFRAGVPIRLLQMRPIVYIGSSLVALLGTTMLAQSIDFDQNPTLKHAAWALSMASVGIMSLSPMMFIPTPVLTRAAMYTVGIVGSLSLVAMNSEQGAFLYYGGPLFAGLTVVALSSVANVFLPVSGTAFRLTHSISLYGGLAVFGGLILFDTQAVMERGELLRQRGVTKIDYINESYVLYWNILNIFVRMVQILGMQAGGGSRKK
jgi:FtsH-binding integral membrane protein